MHAQRFAAGHARRPTLLQRQGKIFDHRLVPGVGEGHGVSPAAGAPGLAHNLLTAIAPVQRELPRTQPGHTFVAADDDKLSTAGVLSGRGLQRADSPAAQGQTGADEVLGFHIVEPGPHGHGLNPGHVTDQRQHQIEAVDRLRDQHTAAVTGESPPPRFVVVSLLTPPGHADFDQPHLAQRAVLQQRSELF